MIYCLDTNIIIDFFHNEYIAVQKMQELEQQQVTMVMTPITLCELYRGIYLSKQQEESLNAVLALRQRVQILEFTIEAAKIYGQNYAELKAKGKPTQEFDLMIASICIAHNAILVTRNAKDFAHIKELKVVQW